MKRRAFLRAGESGATTIEYTMVLGFMASICIFATISLISVLLNRVAVLAVNIAMFLTGIPSP
jgi:Flp pilus assembly pilin Flp